MAFSCSFENSAKQSIHTAQFQTSVNLTWLSAIGQLQIFSTPVLGLTLCGYSGAGHCLGAGTVLVPQQVAPGTVLQVSDMEEASASSVLPWCKAQGVEIVGPCVFKAMTNKHSPWLTSITNNY